MELAIADHDFEKARSYSEEERNEREKLRVLCELFHLEAPRQAPVLCIEVIRDDRFSAVQKRCDEYLAEGVAQVWILDPDSKRAYTATKAEGLREFRGEILRIADPPLEIDLQKIFA
ncbi:MAG TPA: hypothetical protein VKV17_07395 [Bryobacteraceae bacterium]|nr:hypothetical protein [Bryobacteraceae bacterium]